MKNQEQYKVLGLMSGTSLDGLDIAFCKFNKTDTGWAYSVEVAETIRYAKRWMNSLATAHSLTGEDLVSLDLQYGKLLGSACMNFMEKHKVKPDFISSHGHTVFHQPAKDFTFQIGNGNAIHAITNLPVVYDFRTLDVLRGGEGAPLVPAGDKFLFAEYDVCLNLGGIANLSRDVNGQRKAYDICFVNMALNYLAAKVGKSFDKNGAMAADGDIDKGTLRKLNSIYRGMAAKKPSLGREIFEKRIKPLLEDKKISLNNRLRTVTESSASEIIKAVSDAKKIPKVLCTGGGAFNSFLVSRMLDIAEDKVTLIIPEDEIVKFKEALVFAFIGLLRVRDERNCLRSVTGAASDSSSGVLAGF
jgi:anhydro-N-acetylmuramic acid kinase